MGCGEDDPPQLGPQPRCLGNNSAAAHPRSSQGVDRYSFVAPRIIVLFRNSEPATWYKPRARPRHSPVFIESRDLPPQSSIEHRVACVLGQNRRLEASRPSKPLRVG